MATSDWLVRKVAQELRPGERFVFTEAIGGEGQTLTVTAVSADMFGTTEVEVKELDCTIDLGTRQWVTMAPDVEGPRREAEDDTEYTQRRELLAEFLCNMVYGDGAWGEAGEDTRLNYRLDAQDIIKANPHLLSLEERERLGDSIPELAYDGKEESNEG
jgi:hypothetical protein